MGGPRRCSNFELTLSQCLLDKYHVFYALKDLCTGLVVSKEQHIPCEDIDDVFSEHFHCYLRTIDEYFIDELRDIVVINLCDEVYDGSVHLSTIRNVKHWLCYITKEDCYPLYFGVDVSYFNISWKIHNYIRRNCVFDSQHAFIRQHTNQYNVIQRMHTEYWNKKQQEHVKLYDGVVLNRTIGWVRQVKEWFENKENKQHLLVHGFTGYGKSYCVKQMITDYGLWTSTVRLACSSRVFEFSQLNSETSLVYADDINTEYFGVHRQMLLQLMDGGLVTIDPKCGAVKTINLQARFVFCSNFGNLLDNDEALRRRIIQIEATENGIQEV